MLQVVPPLAPIPLGEPLAFPLGGGRLPLAPPRTHSASCRVQPGDGPTRQVPLHVSLREAYGTAHVDRAQRLLVPVDELFLDTEPGGDFISVQQSGRLSGSWARGLLCEKGQQGLAGYRDGHRGAGGQGLGNRAEAGPQLGAHDTAFRFILFRVSLIFSISIGAACWICGACLRAELLSAEALDHDGSFGTNFHVDGLRTPFGLLCCFTAYPGGPSPAPANWANM